MRIELKKLKVVTALAERLRRELRLAPATAEPVSLFG